MSALRCLGSGLRWLLWAAVLSSLRGLRGPRVRELWWAPESLPCQVSPPGAWAPQVATWQSFQFTSIFGLSREAGSPCGLTAGHMDQANSQWAAGEVAAMTSFRSTRPTQQKPDLPRLPALHLECFLSSSAGQEGLHCRTNVVHATLS